MAINLDAIKAKLNQLQTTNTKTSNLWKPEPGKQVIRIIPYQHNKDNPFNELYFHYDLGKKNFLSPITYGRPDPVVEFSSKLKSTGNSDEWKLGKKMEPKMRCYAPIVVRGQESEGIKFWGFGKLVYQELLGVIADPDYGDITDTINCRAILVEFTPAEGAGQFPKTTIRVKPNQSSISDDINVVKMVTENQPNLSDIFKEPSYDELKEALANWLNPEGEDVVDPSSTAPEQAKQESRIPSGVNKVDDVGAAFDDLFN